MSVASDRRTSPHFGAAPPAPEWTPEALLDWLDDGHEMKLATDGQARLRWSSRAFVRAMGGPASAPASLYDVLPEEARTRIDATFGGAPLHDVELELRPPGGAALCVRARALHRDGLVLWSLHELAAERATALQIEQQRELLEMVAQFGHIGVWERDLQTGEGRWDDRVFDFWDLDPKDGTPTIEQVAARIHPDDRERVAYRASLKVAGRHSQHFRVVHRDGSMRWIHAQWQVVHSAQGQPLRAVGLMFDDTQTHELSRSLSLASEQLKLAFELGHITLWRHDLATQRIYMEGSGPSIMGISTLPEGRPISDVRARIHPEDLPRVLNSVEQALRSSQPVDIEARYRQQDGSWRHVLTRRVVQRGLDGGALAFLGVSLDVTERVARERQAMELARQLDIATSAAGIGLWNRALGTDIALWNAQMYTLVGRPRELGPASLDEWLNHVVHPDDRARMSRARYDLTQSLSGTLESEYRIVRPDGDVRWLTHRSSIEVFEGRRIAFGVVLDTTERRQAELALRQTELTARESQAKSQFLARISHELRTPLNAVLGFTQLLQLDDGRLGTASRQVQLAHIRSAGEHLLALINDVLDLTSLQAGQPQFDLQPVDLRELLDDTLPMLAPLAQRSQVEVRAGSWAATVRADRVRLRQVLINLLSNAIKYNRAGGSVSLDATTQDGWVQLRVCDTGRGLTAEQVEHLFEPFNRLGVEPEGIEGSGIGLVIVKALVEAMGGTIVASSEPQCGTVFTLGLPHAEPVPPSASAPAEPAEPVRPRGPRRGHLLYIEDNAVNVMLVEELVRSVPGLSVASEGTGEAGVAHAVRHRPDLVLIDMQLPDIDGLEVLRRLRAEPATAQIRCVALSANAMPSDVAQALSAGFDDYWTKPIDVDRFMRALEALFPAQA